MWDINWQKNYFIIPLEDTLFVPRMSSCSRSGQFFAILSRHSSSTCLKHDKGMAVSSMQKSRVRNSLDLSYMCMYMYLTSQPYISSTHKSTGERRCIWWHVNVLCSAGYNIGRVNQIAVLLNWREQPCHWHCATARAANICVKAIRCTSARHSGYHMSKEC